MGKKMKVMLIAVALAVFAGSAQAGLYRLVFITSANHDALSTDITVYNAWVQSLATAAGLPGNDWRVIGSTDDVDARDNTGTNPLVDGVGVPIYLVDGITKVADDNADLWDGSIQHIIDQDENGVTKVGWPFTGTILDGTQAPGDFGPLGRNVSGNVTQGNSSVTTEWVWRTWTGKPANTTNLPMYAMSEPLNDDPNLPDVYAGDDMITWSGEPVKLDPNVVNNDVTPLTYLWTANPATGVVFDPSDDVEDPNVTITKPASITIAISIVNPGFETPVLADGDYTLDFTNCPGWSDVDAQTAGGVWNPGLPGTAFPGYGGNSPEGQNIAYVNNSGIKQVLTKTLTADTTYTLTVKVGNTDGFPWTGYKVQLLAGETVLAEDDNTVAIATGTFGTSTVTYTYDSGDSALLGQALQIRLFCLGSGGETDFDDVKLTAKGPVPVPYIVTLKLAVNNEGKPAVTDAMKIDVYDDACEAAIITGLTMELDPGNFDGNCIKDFRDIAVLVSTWLVDYTSTGPVTKP
jgi:hypothetical protein